MELPKQLRPCFPSYELSDLDSLADKRLIITNILNFGDTEDLVWLFQAYKTPEIIEVIQDPSRGSWTKEALNYWQVILDVQVEQGKAERALMDPNPRPEAYAPLFM